MAAEITLTDMAACDFSAPMNVTVLYYDSDEDNKASITLITEEDLQKCIDEQVNLESKSSTLGAKIKIGVDRENDSFSEHKSPNNKKLRSEVDDSMNNNRPITPKIDHAEEVLKGDNDNDLIEIQATSKAPNTVNFKNNVSDITLNNSDVNIMRKEFQEVSSYIQNLLTTVSEHLILIINAFEDHSRIIGEYQDRVDGHSRVQESKGRYNRYKAHIFQLSYSAIVSVILPQETDSKFIEAFLNKTVKIAHEKNLSHYAVKYIQPFFYDMLFWTKQKKNYMHHKPAYEVQKPKDANTSNTPMLVEQLSQPPILPKSTRINKKRQHNTASDVSLDQTKALPNNTSNIDYSFQNPQSIPIFRSGPPNREVKICVQPNLLHIQNQQIADIMNGPRTPPPNYQHRATYHYYNTNYNDPYTSTNPHVNTHAYAPRENTAAACDSQYQYNPQSVNQPVSDPRRQYPRQLPAFSNLPVPNKIVKPTQRSPTLRDVRVHHDRNMHQDNGNYQHQYLSLPADLNFIPSYNAEDRCSQNPQNVPPKKVAENEHSPSTDSGFVSPLQFDTGDKTPGDPMEQSSYFAPLITHVTSLNPNAVQIAKGSCHVCGKTTKTKCMGCYQVYYCNYQCENTDWSKHMYLCKRTTVTQ